MNNKIIHLNDDDFENYISKINQLFLIDFWAEWCGPCKMIEPILIEISSEFEKKLIIAKLNIDNNPITTSKYNIRSIPTLVLLRDNKVIANKVGVLSKKQLKDLINENI